MRNSWRSNIRLGSFLMLCLFGLTGCWDVTEVNDIGIVIAAAVDAVPQDKIRYSAQIALPSQTSAEAGPSSGTTGKSTFVLSSVAGDMRTAHREIQLKLSRRVFVAHRDLLLVGQSLAERGFQNFLDEAVRNPESRLRTNVAVTKGDALQYLKVQYPFERVPSEGLRKIVFGGIVTDFNTDLSKIAYMFTTPGSNAMIPIIQLSAPSSGTTPSFKLDGLAIFRGKRMIGQLTTAQGRDVLWLRGEITRGVTTLQVPGKRGYVSCALIHLDTDYSIDLIKGHPNITVHYRVVDDIVENTSQLDLSQSQNIGIVEKCLTDYIRNRLLRTVQVLQKQYDADPVGFGQRVYRAHPVEWPKSRLAAEWEQEFRTLPVKIEVDAIIRRVGMTRRSLTSPAKEQD